MVHHGMLNRQHSFQGVAGHARAKLQADCHVVKMRGKGAAQVCKISRARGNVLAQTVHLQQSVEQRAEQSDITAAAVEAIAAR